MSKLAELARTSVERRAEQAQQVYQRAVATHQDSRRLEGLDRTGSEPGAANDPLELAGELREVLDALRADEWRGARNERDRIADARDRVADARDRLADERDRLADARDASADEGTLVSRRQPREPVGWASKKGATRTSRGTNASRVRRYATSVAPILGVAVAYYGAARLGLLQELVRGQVTPYWPPTGIALVALLLLGLRIWPGIALGAFALNASVGSLAAAPIITAGNTLAPVCAYLLLCRVGFRTEIDRRRDALALVFLGALAGMLVSATIGSAALVLTGAIPATDIVPTWSVWWTGDAMGVLVVTPFLLAIRAHLRIPRGVRWHRWVEAVCLFTCTFVVAAFAMTGSFRLLFLVFPLLVWAAMRFELIGAAPAALIVSTVAIVAAAHEFGPFAGHDLLANMVTLQVFNGSAALTALVLAAVVAERNRAHEQVELAVTQLTSMLGRLDRGPRDQ